MTHEPRSPLFSVVIPTYNRSLVLERAVRTVLAQSFEDFELIIVDDGSTDGTRGMVSTLEDPRIRYLSQPNRGAARARNAGAEAARGALLTFLDSDDEAFPAWLESYAQSFAEGSDIVCCGCSIVERDVPEPRIALPRDLGPVVGHERGLFTQGGVFALRRPIFEMVGGFAEACRANQNTELSYRLVPAAQEHGWRIGTIMEPLLRYHKGNAGSIRGNPEDVLSGTVYLLENHATLLQRDPSLYADYCAVAGVSAARLGRHGQARAWMWRSMRAHPRRPRAWLRAGVALAPPLSAWAWGRRPAA